MRHLVTIKSRFMKRGSVTGHHLNVPHAPYEGDRGMPIAEVAKCSFDKACEEACPTAAIHVGLDQLSIDLGLCIFCGDCVRACQHQAIMMSKEFELASRRREGLVRVHVIRH